MKIYLAVGIGGMVGASGRYGISILFWTNTSFPYATLIANLLGCFLLSFLLHHDSIKRKLSPEVFAALGTGMIGSFTTFSTFAVETVELFDSSILLAGSYIVLSVIGGLLFCYLGFKMAFKKRVTA
ncbi:fluoride efflux transporter CrcB [Virgibacillus litoralis]|uniref:Fluoride-specific ion channel FluC n=1 Tax=Virgibacillus litoralis TaxID=578221 RepID=A0ABS4HGW9_9BACI|nr:fluoride efflux transporter CrcB [Virgibacillus litoralis]MBP1950151.1 CrcB protein [Virgibacillus litoralis]